MDAETFIDILKFELNWGWSQVDGAIQGTSEAIFDVYAELWELLKNIFSNFFGMFQDLSQIIHILDFLPDVWTGLFIALLLTVVGLRIYAFFSDVSIAGFKI